MTKSDEDPETAAIHHLGGEPESPPAAWGFIGWAYSFATLATIIKTVAWWFNQWPFISHYDFFLKWFFSALVAGGEYLPLTYSFGYAVAHNVPLSLMTAYMESADNFFRMFQQLALGLVLYWFDWVAAVLLAAFVAFQGYFHWRHEKASSAKLIEDERVEESPAQDEAEKEEGGADMSLYWVIITMVVLVFSAGMIALALTAGRPGQVYALATIATAAKTFAWWINQYPALKDKSLQVKWLAGWSIAAIFEYLPLVGAFSLASRYKVHLGLMTAYMEALDNLFRIAQQVALLKPLYWFDWCAGAGMVLTVVFQGVMHYITVGGVAEDN